MGKWIEHRYSDWQNNVYWLYECTTCHKEEKKKVTFALIVEIRWKRMQMSVIIEQKGEPDYKRVKCNCCNSILRYLDVDEKQDNYADGYFGPETVAISSALTVVIRY